MKIYKINTNGIISFPLTSLSIKKSNINTKLKLNNPDNVITVNR